MGSFSKTLQQTKTEPDVPDTAAEQPEELKPPAVWEDPRPDLAEDHRLWQRFLKMASVLPDEKEAYQLVGVLNGLRCGGTLLVKGNNGFVIRPLIDPVNGWSSQQEYEELRDKYVKPHIDKIKVLLSVLKQECWYW